MALAGEGPRIVASMYVMSFLVFIFVILRLYVRVRIVSSWGSDDYVFVFAFVLLLCYSIFMHVACTYGAGQNMWDIEDPLDIMHAVLYQCIAQTFAVIGMGVAKWSLGLFLLRLVEATWHKMAIWATLANMSISSIMCVFFFWFQCDPAPYLWDRSIPGGKCELPQLEVSYYLGVSTVFTDFFFALFPWIFMWNLQMNKREKIVILCSMSLGVIAAGFGIKRTTEIPNLLSENFLKDTVEIILWSAAEMSVTLICIGIPVCRPLYKKYLDRLTSNKGSSYNKYGHKLSGTAPNDVPLRTFGGGETGPGAGKQPPQPSAFRGSSNASTDKSPYGGDDSNSDEEALTGAVGMPGRHGPLGDDKGIHVRSEFVVHSSKRDLR